MAVSKRIIMQQKIQELKEMGLTKTGIIRYFEQRNETPPSWPTVSKYYDMDGSESSDNPFAKDRAFDEEPYRTVIIEILQRNSRDLRISSIYDVLQEKYIDTGEVAQLPGNEQTLRNYVRWLRETNQVPLPQVHERQYDQVEQMPPGKQLLIDFGEQKIAGGITIHFMCMLLRFSHFLFVVVQDHKFDAAASCRGIYRCFKRIGGRVEQLVIDQDKVFVYEEQYGEIIATQTFGAFLKEQELSLWVCRKADPESKGPIEKSVQFVKQNYFSARNLQTLSEVKTGIAGWLNRKNARILPNTLRIPAAELETERSALRPLAPSLYAIVEDDFHIYEVKGTPHIRYHTNKYSVPRSYRHQSVKFKVVSEAIHIFDIATGEKIVQHQVDARKGVTITLPEHRKEESTAWKSAAMSLKVKYWCASMDHFINGVCKENPRYRLEQLQAIERFLDKRHPVDRKMLESVLGRCCQHFAYRVSEFEQLWQQAVEQKDGSELPFGSQDQALQPRIEVQHRGMESYSRAFRRLASPEGGSR